MLSTPVLAVIAGIFVSWILWRWWTARKKYLPPDQPKNHLSETVRQAMLGTVQRCHLCQQYGLTLQEEQHLHRRILQLHRTHPTRQRGFASLSTDGPVRLPSE